MVKVTCPSESVEVEWKVGKLRLRDGQLSACPTVEKQKTHSRRGRWTLHHHSRQPGVEVGDSHTLGEKR